jgi:hypothetical protein
MNIFCIEEHYPINRDSFGKFKEPPYIIDDREKKYILVLQNIDSLEENDNDPYIAMTKDILSWVKIVIIEDNKIRAEEKLNNLKKHFGPNINVTIISDASQLLTTGKDADIYITDGIVPRDSNLSGNFVIIKDGDTIRKFAKSSKKWTMTIAYSREMPPYEYMCTRNVLNDKGETVAGYLAPKTMTLFDKDDDGRAFRTKNNLDPTLNNVVFAISLICMWVENKKIDINQLGSKSADTEHHEMMCDSKIEKESVCNNTYMCFEGNCPHSYYNQTRLKCDSEKNITDVVRNHIMLNDLKTINAAATNLINNNNQNEKTLYS